MSSEALFRFRRVVTPWRIAFVLYALALTTGTHWPSLQLGPAIPATDKTVHMFAFAGLTLLLWRTRWIRRLWIIGVIALVWAAIDESTQNIPILNRTASTHDMIANALGVIVMLALIWAMQPLGVAGGPNRLRLRLHQYVIDEMFARRDAWLAGVAGAAAGAVPLVVYVALFTRTTAVSRAVILSGIMIAVFVTFMLWRRMWMRILRETLERRPCLECGADRSQMRVDSNGDAACTRCGAMMPAAQWIWPPEPPLRLRAAIGVRPALMALGALVLIFAVILITPIVYAHALGTPGAGISAMRLARMIGTLPPTLVNVIDLAAYLLLLAVVVRVYRGGLARFHDRSTRCRRCGHDLRGTPTNRQGIGRCGECGTEFARVVVVDELPATATERAAG